MNFFSTNELRPKETDGWGRVEERRGRGRHSCKQRQLSKGLTTFAQAPLVLPFDLFRQARPSAQLGIFQKKVSLPLKSTLSLSRSLPLFVLILASLSFAFSYLSLCLSLSAPAIIDYATCPLALIISTQSQLAS